MATKPTPGGSDGTYGTEMNAFLDISLASDGKVKDGAVFSTSAAPSVDAGVANKKYVDDTVPTTFAVSDGSTVLFATGNLTTANTFQDINASGTVGSNSALLIIKIVVAGGITVAARTNGESGTGAAWGSDGAGVVPRGAQNAHMDTTGDIATLVVMTDSSGIFEIAGSSNSVDITVTLIGYIVAS